MPPLRHQDFVKSYLLKLNKSCLRIEPFGPVQSDAIKSLQTCTIFMRKSSICAIASYNRLEVLSNIAWSIPLCSAIARLCAAIPGKIHPRAATYIGISEVTFVHTDEPLSLSLPLFHNLRRRYVYLKVVALIC